MPHQVTFIYHTGVAHAPLRAARLSGSWDSAGRPSQSWTTMDMESIRDEAGGTAFRALVSFDESAVGATFRWGVFVDGPAGAGVWGIPTEVRSSDSQERTRSFTLEGGPQTEEYFLTYLRRLGANKFYSLDEEAPGIRFSVWAPNARAVELVFGDIQNGYIDDNGGGITTAPGAFPLDQNPQTGIWSIDTRASPALGTFASCDHQRAYMFKVTRDDGTINYATDIYSRCQIGSGKVDPQGQPYAGRREDLDGTKSCSLVCDPDRVMERFDEPFPQTHWLDEEDFWRDETNASRPVPNRIEDLVIYELHVPGLGYGRPDPGHLADAIKLLDHLVDLGVNAVELLPMSEYEGWAQWGYASSHYFAIEYASGGRDQFKHFVRACHQRGIAVIVDVVYNHFAHHGERAEWAYDSYDPRRNIYYWYEGNPGDYPAFQAAVDPLRRDHGGYIDNMSTAWAPRYWEEPVRQLFISSAVALMVEFHVDGFRVDQTTSIHAYANVHADGRPAHAARAFGAKFLREWTRTAKLLRPDVMLIAEDHSGWDAVTRPTDEGGLGFDSAWYADFYHHLSGDTGKGADYANLLQTAGLGDNRPLALDHFAGALAHTSPKTVVYHESHDEAGNSHGTGWSSHRTIHVAVNGAPLVDATRDCAEARCRVAATLAMLSAGVPMFFMGEEVGFCKPYRYDDFMSNREDILGLRDQYGARLFRFYRDLLHVRSQRQSLRGGGLRIVYVHNANRVLAFRRWNQEYQSLVVVSLANDPYADGYEIVSDQLPDMRWREILNSNASHYGGTNTGNLGGTIASKDGRMRLALPANAAIVFEAV